jgi:phosphatidylethanolamine/phosphatidyl-N-methylethanolamine N-methyltransferase
MKEDEFCSGLYSEVQSKGLIGWYVRQSHLALEKGFKIPDQTVVLEVGANLGEHLQYVNPNYRKYILTDYRDTGFVSKNPNVEFRQANVEDLPFEDQIFDRLIATCLLHHLDNPIEALIEMRRVVKPGGVISISLPCDPGFLYRLSKKIGPDRAWKKAKAGDPEFFHYSQHRNHYPAILSYIKNVFAEDTVSCKNWPLNIPTWNGNLFSVIQIEKETKSEY